MKPWIEAAKCSIIRNIFHFTFMIPVQSLPVSKISKNAWIKSKRRQTFKLRCPTVLAPVSAWRVNQSLVVGEPVILGGWTDQNAILISPPSPPLLILSSALELITYFYIKICSSLKTKFPDRPEWDSHQSSFSASFLLQLSFCPLLPRPYLSLTMRPNHW